MPDGVYDGSRCPPEKREAIKQHVLNGTPVQAIAERVHASTSTVRVVRDQELPEWRQEQSSGLKRLARSMVHHFNAVDLNDIPWAVKPVMFGIVMDKIAILDGEPTAIVEHRHSLDMSTLRDGLVQAEINVTPLQNGDKLAIPAETPANPA